EAGADIEYLENTNYPPLKIVGTGLKAGTVSIDGSISSQFLTAFLMSAPLAEGEVRIKIEGDLVSKPYIDITLHIMKQFGVEVINNDYQEFVIPAGQHYVAPGDFLVEGDASSASYFLAA
ncbi:EPSP synthase family protein, partial [Vibrio parahaemolyticus V-223/04]